MDRTAYYLVWFEVVEEQTASHHVCHGIQGTNLVKMDVFEGGVVDMSFGAANYFIYFYGVCFYDLINIKMGERLIGRSPMPRSAFSAVRFGSALGMV